MTVVNSLVDTLSLGDRENVTVVNSLVDTLSLGDGGECDSS